MGQVPLDELEVARDAGQLIADVGDRTGYTAGRIFEAQLMLLQDLPARVHELRGRAVYGACQKGGRSAEAARLLPEAGGRCAVGHRRRGVGTQRSPGRTQVLEA